MTIKQLHDEVVSAAKAQGFTKCNLALDRVRTNGLSATLYVTCSTEYDGAIKSDVFIVDAKFETWKDFGDVIGSTDKQWKSEVIIDVKREEVEQTTEEPEKPIGG